MYMAISLLLVDKNRENILSHCWIFTDNEKINLKIQT